ncbi:hypothetical protein ETAA8_63990 [Anatilimnocola aggregata]|uniref:Uncharacterized protein n=1 Tax=Anatilimnocola aggregata TaxID=2528021 RepID=A0A517YLZ7_9BACT|nr:hypothetical protein [Anatilimnocola aggregata]QDU31246.1 hypothetical protein ETAA8_63990 [Anatilimnocola aggregata]
MARTLADQPRRYGPARQREHGQSRKRKNGIVLLMVVSLLALFLLMGVTFAVLAMQYNTAAKMHAGVNRYGDDPMMELDLAFGQVLYGTDTRSSLQGHDLLRDLYGTDYVRGTVKAVSTDTQKTLSGHFLVFSTTASLSTRPGYYNGRVITFITGNARNLSTRIAGYEPEDVSTSECELFVEPINGNGGTTISPAANDQFVINGQPFNGMGFGYDSSTYRLDAVDNTTNNRPAVLLPHYAGYTEQGVYSSVGGAGPFSVDGGGADEPWDAADLQNLHLSVVPPSLIASRKANNRFGVPLIPSYVRPELINYWLESSRWPSGSIQLTNQSQKDFARQIIFRPMPWDHTNFTGSNPDLTPSANTDAAYETLIRKMAQQNAMQDLSASNPNGYWEAIWDVDNDGDGVRESVWVDIGLPVMTSPTGRRYKRLYAFLIKDLDGRINVNVHGNRSQLDTANQASYDIPYPFPIFSTTAQPAAATFPNDNRVGGTQTASLKLPRGLGFGPAEVDYRLVLNSASLNGNYGNLLLGRYGSDNAPGKSGEDDPLSVLRTSGIPGYYVSMDSWYGSPPDVWGRSAVAIDFGGRPFFFRGRLPNVGTFATAPETWDDPYEMEWDAATAINDTPYSVLDMERMLRNHDNDMGHFNGRLVNAANALFSGAGQPDSNSGAYQRVRESLSTMGSYIPTVPAILRQEDRNQHGSLSSSNAKLSATNAPTIVGMYIVKLQQGGFDTTNTTNLKAELAKIMPWEFWQGTPLNINRYLGNGINDNSTTNKAIDEVLEATSNEDAWGTNSSGTQSSAPSGGALPGTGGFSGQRAFPVNSVDVDRDGAQDGASGATNDRRYARHLLARHLYCLAMALKGNSYNPPKPNGGGNLSNAETARLLAQWAVNVVDFRDVDGIMTGFEYDTNPWNGWSVDGNLATVETSERGVVWGCEAPELLLTEALAFHDRRVRDTAHDTTKKKVEEPTTPDDDLDQFRVPQGSLFFELYCPRTHTMYNQPGTYEAMYSPQMPFELYDKSTGKLDLGRMSPGTSGRASPVWQVAISSVNANQDGLPHSQVLTENAWETSRYAEPADATITGRQFINLQYDENNPGRIVEIERYVWFTNTDGGATNPKQDRVFYNQKDWTAQVAPGQYMVVGPREKTVLGSNNKDVGREVGDWHGPSLQEINLSSTTGVSITDAGGNTTSKLSTPSATAEIQPPAALVVDIRPPTTWMNAGNVNRRVGVNITEPLPNAIPAVGGSYYPEYNVDNLWSNPLDSYDNPVTYSDPPLIPDAPQDNTRLLGTSGLLETRYHARKAGVFLQRLADPTQDWDPLSNPYITVDFAPVDLSVFNGEEDTDQQVPSGTPSMMVNIDRDDPPDPTGNARPSRLFTSQRGVQRGNPWFPQFIDTPTNPAVQNSGDRFMRLGLHHTLGYINPAMGTPRTAAQSGNYASYTGDPGDTDKPFPWIPFHNRPFMNPAELLLVPTCAPNRLNLEITPDNPYVAVGANPYTATSEPDFNGGFGYLLNMFQSNPTDTDGFNLSRLFDFVETPSNFVKTEKWYSPNSVNNTDTLPSPRPEYRPPYLYRPPFNRLSRFRDPGRININTIFDEPIWNSIIGYDPSDSTYTGSPSILPGLRVPFSEVMVSRQGISGGSLGRISQTHPTIFANPFRPANSADLMPAAGNMRKSPVEATFFRSSTSRTGEPLFGYRSSEASINTDRNPYFRYQGIQKINNIVSTQSNCYAVWVTVGYFEVEEATIGAAHPDGFMLGQELGMDTGDIQRHRAFYLLDRSIPVGFIPGLKLNADNCVLLRRQID